MLKVNAEKVGGSNLVKVEMEITQEDGATRQGVFFTNTSSGDCHTVANEKLREFMLGGIRVTTPESAEKYFRPFASLAKELVPIKVKDLPYKAIFYTFENGSFAPIIRTYVLSHRDVPRQHNEVGVQDCSWANSYPVVEKFEWLAISKETTVLWGGAVLPSHISSVFAFSD